jgi:hypothetical protein
VSTSIIDENMKERRYTVQYDGPWGQHVHVITKSAGFNSQWWMYDDHSDYYIDEVPNVICIANTSTEIPAVQKE